MSAQTRNGVGHWRSTSITHNPKIPLYCGSRVAICDNRGERLSWTAAGILSLLDMKIGTPNLVPRLAGSWIMKGPHGIMINHTWVPRMKIIDLKCAVLGGSPVVRITTDAGIQRLCPGGDLQAVLEAPRSAFARGTPRPRSQQRRARDAAYPSTWRLQAVGHGGKRHRDSSLGSRRKSRRCAGL